MKHTDISVGSVSYFFPETSDISVSRVTNHPWASTHKIVVRSDVFYLKEMRQRSGCAPDYLSALSEIAQPHVPNLIGVNPAHDQYLYTDFDADVFEEKLSTDDKRAALRVYARIQRQSLDNTSFEKHLPHVTCMSAFEMFHHLLKQAESEIIETQAKGNPFLHMSSASVRDYVVLFRYLKPVLKSLFMAAEVSPNVINHCDLRPKNIAKRSSGEIVIFDWDDAVWAPPGLSLHAQFSGCSRVLRALKTSSKWGSDRDVQNRRILDSYKNSLRRHSDFANTDLDSVIAASAVAGVFHYVAGFAPYAISSSASRTAIKKNIRRRLSDLLTGLETLAADNTGLRDALYKAYRATGRADRAKALVAARPKPVDLATDVHPMPIDAVFDIKDFGTQSLSKEQIDRATKAFDAAGCLVLHDVIERKHVDACRDEFFEKIDDHDEAISQGEALRVGDKRYMLSPSLENAFCRPELLTATPLMQVLEPLLGPGFVLGSFTAVASAPGAAAQKIHRDNPLLFPEKGHMDIPSFCIAVIIPLVDVTAETGTTRLWPGSHRKSSRHVKDITPADPYVTTGGCYLMDSAVFHQGLANVSDTIRPILSLVFQRPWYRDHKNFNYQNAVNLSQDAKDHLHPDVAKLVSWVKPT